MLNEELIKFYACSPYCITSHMTGINSLYRYDVVQSNDMLCCATKTQSTNDLLVSVQWHSVPPVWGWGRSRLLSLSRCPWWESVQTSATWTWETDPAYKQTNKSHDFVQHLYTGMGLTPGSVGCWKRSPTASSWFGSQSAGSVPSSFTHLVTTA